MRGPSDESRQEARKRYESGEPLKAVARNLSIDPKTLRAMRDREGWIPPLTPPGGDDRKAEIRSRVIDFTTRKAIEQVVESGVIEKQADLIAENLALHGEIGMMALTAVKQTFNAYSAGQITPGMNQNQADVLKSVLSAAKLGIDMTRDVAGLKSGQISAKQSKLDGARKYTFTIAPQPPEALSEAS